MNITIILQALLALIIVIALCVAALYLFKRFYHAKIFKRNKLWHVDDIYYLDTSNKILEVSRDNKKYTLLIGKNNNLILSSDDDTTTQN